MCSFLLPEPAEQAYEPLQNWTAQRAKLTLDRLPSICGAVLEFAGEVSDNSSHLAATFNALLPHRAITAPFRRSAGVRVLLSTRSYNTSVGSRFFLSRRDIRKNKPNGHKKYSEQEWQ
jgi:hypothetical protein